MKEISYKITFFSEWHTGSGLTSGSDLDALVIKDKNNFPYIPGKTIKGLIKEAAEEIIILKGGNPRNEAFITKFFGFFDDLDINESKIHTKGNAYFTDAALSPFLKKQAIDLTEFLYKDRASTAIAENGLAEKNSLRKMETTIPCELIASIFYQDNHFENDIKQCLHWIKRLGLNRNRGLGRCKFEILEIKEVAV